ncbi:hypothetical protein PsYK624_158110 [Phanerochaete sordida]|uniref:Uncharacterized protein n=1 Tax=Phanerochaete sordida TaxID=48140 RepID=A0A9P3GTU8_9APHY|nr:hypothetical protein PsYK624_158110 [Phanerochaete sordida]
MATLHDHMKQAAFVKLVRLRPTHGCLFEINSDRCLEILRNISEQLFDNERFENEGDTSQKPYIWNLLFEMLPCESRYVLKMLAGVFASNHLFTWLSRVLSTKHYPPIVRWALARRRFGIGIDGHTEILQRKDDADLFETLFREFERTTGRPEVARWVTTVFGPLVFPTYAAYVKNWTPGWDVPPGFPTSVRNRPTHFHLIPLAICGGSTHEPVEDLLKYYTETAEDMTVPNTFALKSTPPEPAASVSGTTAMDPAVVGSTAPPYCEMTPVLAGTTAAESSCETADAVLAETILVPSAFTTPALEAFFAGITPVESRMLDHSVGELTAGESTVMDHQEDDPYGYCDMDLGSDDEDCGMDLESDDGYSDMDLGSDDEA